MKKIFLPFLFLLVTYSAFSQVILVSDDSWKGDTIAPVDNAWTLPGFDDSNWAHVSSPNSGSVSWTNPAPGAPFMWLDNSKSYGSDTDKVYLRKTFGADIGEAYSVQLDANADNEFYIYFNGALLGHYDDWTQGPYTFTVFPALNPGLHGCEENVIAVEAINWSGPSGMSVKATITVTNPLNTPNDQPATDLACSSFTANWDAVPTADYYLLDVSEDPTFSTFFNGYQDFNVGSALSLSISGINQGTAYYYRVRAVRGTLTSCYGSTINYTPSMVVHVNSPSICIGNGPVTLTASGAVTYTWSAGASPTAVDGSTASVPEASVSYTVTGTDGTCSDSAVATVTVNQLPTVTVNSPTICSGETAHLTAGGATSYTWSAGATPTGSNTANASPTTLKTYTVTGTKNGCSNTAVSTVSVTQKPTVNVNSPAICAGQIAHLTATGGTSYVWGVGATSTGVNTADASPASPTTIDVIGTTDGCSDTATATITVHALPTPDITSDFTIGCQPMCINLTETGSSCTSVQYKYSDTDSSSSPQHCYNQSGTYSITVKCTDANQCEGSITKTDFITVVPVPKSNFSFAPSGVVATYVPIVFTSISTGDSQIWDFDDPSSGANNTSTLVSPTHTYANEGTYCIKLVSSNASTCTDTSEYCVVIANDPWLFIPNVFTPNGDGSNDVFSVQTGAVKDLTCTITDCWGLKMSEWNSITGAWDGRTKSSNLAPDGVYYYTIKATGTNGKEIEKYGFVQLLR